MIRSKLHLVATMRSKMEYVVETNDKGKSAPRKVGLAPVQREGMDYEFDIVFDLDLNHNALSTKDRSSLFDGKMISKPDEKVGARILEWLNRGAVPIPDPVTPPTPLAVPPAPVPSTVKVAPAQAPKQKSTVLAQPKAILKPETAERIPLFSDPPITTGEKETNTMLEAIANATSTDRLFAIDKSRRLGYDTNRLTLDQARRIRQAIDKRQSDLNSGKSQKAA
jgi:hypothetical protein